MRPTLAMESGDSRECARGGVVATLALACILSACGGPGSSGPYEPNAFASRDTARAQELNREAVDKIEDEPAEAERLLRAALTADLYFGPAHNNLGVVFLKQEKLYEAASEFEWAKKLMPGHPDPLVNLGLVLESASREDDALAAYGGALEVYSAHLGAMQAAARLKVRRGTASLTSAEKSDLLRQLREVAMRGETDEWRSWAKRELLRLAPDAR